MITTTTLRLLLAALALTPNSPVRAGDEPELTTRTGHVAAEKPEGRADNPERAAREQNLAARRQVVVPARLWLQALRTIDLDEVQRKALESRLNAHRDAMIAFTEVHGEELRALRIRLRENRGNPEVMKVLRREMQAFEKKMPRYERVQQDLWRLLREDQQEAMRARLTEIREEIIKRRKAGKTAKESESAKRAGDRFRARRPAAHEGEGKPLRSRRSTAHEGPTPRGRDE